MSENPPLSPCPCEAGMAPTAYIGINDIICNHPNEFEYMCMKFPALQSNPVDPQAHLPAFQRWQLKPEYPKAVQERLLPSVWVQTATLASPAGLISARGACTKVKAARECAQLHMLLSWFMRTRSSTYLVRPPDLRSTRRRECNPMTLRNADVEGDAQLSQLAHMAIVDEPLLATNGFSALPRYLVRLLGSNNYPYLAYSTRAPSNEHDKCTFICEASTGEVTTVGNDDSLLKARRAALLQLVVLSVMGVQPSNFDHYRQVHAASRAGTAAAERRKAAWTPNPPQAQPALMRGTARPQQDDRVQLPGRIQPTRPPPPALERARAIDPRPPTRRRRSRIPPVTFAAAPSAASTSSPNLHVLPNRGGEKDSRAARDTRRRHRSPSPVERNRSITRDRPDTQARIQALVSTSLLPSPLPSNASSASPVTMIVAPSSASSAVIANHSRFHSLAPERVPLSQAHPITPAIGPEALMLTRVTSLEETGPRQLLADQAMASATPSRIASVSSFRAEPHWDQPPLPPPAATNVLDLPPFSLDEYGSGMPPTSDWNAQLYQLLYYAPSGVPPPPVPPFLFPREMTGHDMSQLQAHPLFATWVESPEAALSAEFVLRFGTFLDSSPWQSSTGNRPDGYGMYKRNVAALEMQWKEGMGDTWEDAGRAAVAWVLLCRAHAT
ncbi:hypothetical protein BC828DRAFT_169874 [Blastocladiella britannica]|nr:hypothetical protein BC828DRAFT_169874 [Blastocladiella britannica]